MSAEAISLVVYFEDPFWVGVCERLEDDLLQAAKVTFGAEPKDAEVWELVCTHWHALDFSPCVDACAHAKGLPANPKRRQRAARRAVAFRGASTRSQLALSRARELEKQEHQSARRERREALTAAKYAKKKQKRKEKHGGH